MPNQKRGKPAPPKRKTTKLADAHNKINEQRLTLEQAAEWKAPTPVDAKEYAAAQRQYYFGVSAEEMRQHTAMLALEMSDSDNKLRDRVELLKGLAEWKKIEIALARMAQEEAQHQPQDANLPMPSDAELAVGVRLMLEHVEVKQELVVEDAVVVDDEEVILPLEGVG